VVRSADVHYIYSFVCGELGNRVVAMSKSEIAACLNGPLRGTGENSVDGNSLPTQGFQVCLTDKTKANDRCTKCVHKVPRYANGLIRSNIESESCFPVICLVTERIRVVTCGQSLARGYFGVLRLSLDYS
jgi:hypothetical protein